MAVAISVRSVEEKPSLEASVRPVCRARTMSKSDAIEMHVSATSHFDLSPGLKLGRAAALIGFRFLLTQLLSVHTPCSKRTSFSSDSFGLTVEKRQALLQVQCRSHTGQVGPELHQGKCNFRLDSDDHSFRTTQADHLGNVAQGTRGKRIHYIKGRDVDDHAPRSELAHLQDDAIPQLHQICITQGRLDCGNEVLPLFENRYLHDGPLMNQRDSRSVARLDNPGLVQLLRYHPEDHRQYSSCRDRLQS